MPSGANLIFSRPFPSHPPSLKTSSEIPQNGPQLWSCFHLTGVGALELFPRPSAPGCWCFWRSRSRQVIRARSPPGLCCSAGLGSAVCLQWEITVTQRMRRALCRAGDGTRAAPFKYTVKLFRRKAVSPLLNISSKTPFLLIVWSKTPFPKTFACSHQRKKDYCVIFKEKIFGSTQKYLVFIVSHGLLNKWQHMWVQSSTTN